MRWRVAAAALTAGVVAVVVIVVHRAPPASVPSFAAVRADYRPSDVRLLDRHGEVLHELRIDSRRRRLEWTPLADISPALQRAVVTAEDRRFYAHHGVDAQALLGAAAQRLAGHRLRGASTITMQLVALLDPAARPQTAARTLAQKWRQMQLAWAIEQRWSKTEILEAYLNLVTFRGELQGIAAAASVLFGKSPHGITEPEALVLAVLVQSPNAGHTAVLRRAVNLQAASQGTGTDNDLDAAVAQALNAPPGTGPRVTLAPHVAHALLRHAAPAAPVRSTLDAATQRRAADALQRTLLAVRARHVEDGAALVVDNRSGDVLAYVGSSGVLSSAAQVDGVRARRQAGSALKPFLYGLAFDQRLLTPASLLEDTPLEIAVTGGLYRPQDYDEQFRGLVSARTALAASLNVPAVRVLELVGEEPFVQQLRRLGFTGLSESGEYYGPALALGGTEVTLWELTNAYRALANGGAWSPLRLTDTGDNRGTRPVYSAAAAFLVANVLADRESRSVTFGLDNPLSTRFWTAVKTGTSKDMRDNWCIGFSQRYTVGVWVGNFSGAPMQDVSGVTGAAPVWLEIMSWLHRDVSSQALAAPAGVHARNVTFSPAAGAPRSEWFLTGTEPGDTTLAAHHASIITPVSGTRIALDPDIPAAQQRVLFEAGTESSDARFVVDGRTVGAAGRPLLWEPRAGEHTLALVDGKDRELDQVSFTVRGALMPATGE